MNVYNTTSNNITVQYNNYKIYQNYIYTKFSYIYEFIYYIKTIYILCICIYYFNKNRHIILSTVYFLYFIMAYIYNVPDLLHLQYNNTNHIQDTIRNELNNVFREYEEILLNYYPIHYIDVIAPYIDTIIDDTCSICLEDFNQHVTDINTDINKNKKIRKTVCRHYYCDICIQQWLTTHNTCPMCKYDLSRNICYDSNSNNTGQ
jgi:hypothetical protein